MKRWEKRVTGDQARNALKMILDHLKDVDRNYDTIEAIARAGLQRPKYTPTAPRKGGSTS